ncbi:proline racemase family protein [candidate division KSB1 bacterium]
MTSLKKWNPPGGWTKITSIDAHTEGEPLRVITGGFPELQGDTILARRRYASENLDHLRTALMWEPRGHADMYGCIITEAVTKGADFGVLFIHNEGFSTMCGHGIIGVTKVALEAGMISVPCKDEIATVRIDTPAGLVTAHARMENGSVRSVYFHNVPSFVYAVNEMVEVDGIGAVRYDIAFGGAFYAYVRAEEVGLELTPGNFRSLIEKGMDIKRAVMEHHPVVHPFEKDLSFLYGTIFIGPPRSDQADSRNVCVFAEGEVDRSPTGTGVSGRMAIHFARNEIGLNQPMTIESIIGSRFTGRVVEKTVFGPYDAVIPEIEGTAFITGRHEFVFDPEDPLGNGFMLR